MAIKKNLTDRNPNTRGDHCWRMFSRPPHLVLRIELCSGRVWLLPYVHWLHADLHRIDRGELLTIQFGSHEVRVEGENLSEVLLELQTCNVELLREIPPQYLPLVNSAVIRTISVSEAMDSSGEEAARDSSIDRNQPADALN